MNKPLALSFQTESEHPVNTHLSTLYLNPIPNSQEKSQVPRYGKRRIMLITQKHGFIDSRKRRLRS